MLYKDSASSNEMRVTCNAVTWYHVSLVCKVAKFR